jgi:hypothetical protein
MPRPTLELRGEPVKQRTVGDLACRPGHLRTERRKTDAGVCLRTWVFDTMTHVAEPLRITARTNAQQETIHRQRMTTSSGHDLGSGVTIERDTTNTQPDAFSC